MRTGLYYRGTTKTILNYFLYLGLFFQNRDFSYFLTVLFGFLEYYIGNTAQCMKNEVGPDIFYPALEIITDTDVCVGKEEFSRKT